ncbi:MAG TPA: hypothetical protein VK589_27740 [Chryseolinea sp.]|nr:hypothetical protein [Chryseolinea sp.]
MITMEFDEIKKVWDSQNNEPIYGINEKALHNRILAKKSQAFHITNVSELLAVVANFGGGSFMLAFSLYKESTNIFLYLLAAWMFVTGVYVLISRVRRLKDEGTFDRTVLGDLRHAIAVATYQVQLSFLLRWNIVPIGILVILSVWDGGRSVWLAIGLIIFLFIANYFAGWEHNFYKSRRRELETLLEKLDGGEE